MELPVVAMGANGSVVRGLQGTQGLQAVVVVVTPVAREAQRLHGLHEVSAMLLGEALAGGALLASLQKENTRLNLQLECDGPLRGLFVDATSDGALRGYVKNPYLSLEGNRGPGRWRPALGNSGFLSVLRDLGEGEHYRSSVELKAMELGEDLAHYFATSDQVATAVAVAVERAGDEPLGAVAGALVQALPDGQPGMLEQVGAKLAARLEEAVRAQPGADAAALMERLFPGFPVTARAELKYFCPCSKERVMEALAALPRADVKKLLETRGTAVANCQFCGKRHEATRAELEALLH